MYLMIDDQKVDVGVSEVIVNQPYIGVGIAVDDGLFGICARDGGLEVIMPSGEVISIRYIEGKAVVTNLTLPEEPPGKTNGDEG